MARISGFGRPAIKPKRSVDKFGLDDIGMGNMRMDEADKKPMARPEPAKPSTTKPTLLADKAGSSKPSLADKARAAFGKLKPKTSAELEAERNVLGQEIKAEFNRKSAEAMAKAPKKAPKKAAVKAAAPVKAPTPEKKAELVVPKHSSGGKGSSEARSERERIMAEPKKETPRLTKSELKSIGLPAKPKSELATSELPMLKVKTGSTARDRIPTARPTNQRVLPDSIRGAVKEEYAAKKNPPKPKLEKMPQSVSGSAGIKQKRSSEAGTKAQMKKSTSRPSLDAKRMAAASEKPMYGRNWRSQLNVPLFEAKEMPRQGPTKIKLKKKR